MTKTEELREKIRQIVSGPVDWSGYDKAPTTGEECDEIQTYRILKVCQEADLAFVVKDAELPDSILKVSQLERAANKFPDCGGGDWEMNVARVQRNHTERVIRKAGFRQTKEIELT